MKYLITFSIFGKEMKCTITGKSKDDAEYKLRGKLKIVTIEPFVGESVIPDVVNDIMDMFK